MFAQALRSVFHSFCAYTIQSCIRNPVKIADSSHGIVRNDRIPGVLKVLDAVFEHSSLVVPARRQESRDEQDRYPFHQDGQFDGLAPLFVGTGGTGLGIR